MPRLIHADSMWSAFDRMSSDPQSDASIAHDSLLQMEFPGSVYARTACARGLTTDREPKSFTASPLQREELLLTPIAT